MPTNTALHSGKVLYELFNRSIGYAAGTVMRKFLRRNFSLLFADAFLMENFGPIYFLQN